LQLKKQQPKLKLRLRRRSVTDLKKKQLLKNQNLSSNLSSNLS
jgi:hypothetical protein